MSYEVLIVHLWSMGSAESDGPDDGTFTLRSEWRSGSVVFIPEISVIKLMEVRDIQGATL